MCCLLVYKQLVLIVWNTWVTLNSLHFRSNWYRLRQGQQRIIPGTSGRRPNNDLHSNVLCIWEPYLRLFYCRSSLPSNGNSPHGGDWVWNRLGLHTSGHPKVPTYQLPVRWLRAPHRRTSRFLHLLVLRLHRSTSAVHELRTGRRFVGDHDRFVACSNHPTDCVHLRRVMSLCRKRCSGVWQARTLCCHISSRLQLGIVGSEFVWD